MTTTAKHTPTPWVHEIVETSCGHCIKIGAIEQLNLGRIDRLSIPSYACIYVDYGRAFKEAIANAAFIVEACNAHDKFKANNEKLMEVLSDILRNEEHAVSAGIHKYQKGSDTWKVYEKGRLVLAAVGSDKP